MRPAPFRSDRSWRFDATGAEVWQRIAATDDYRRWWPWLSRFDPAEGLALGSRWSCEVSPPLPYVVRFEIHIDRIEVGRLIEATVRGDIAGTARLTLEPGASGTRARLVSDLRPTNPLLRAFGVVARPLVERGHDWILDQGRRQFVERALE
jgi:uncharacterized protein YndB with AHSA1/START domain